MEIARGFHEHSYERADSIYKSWFASPDLSALQLFQINYQRGDLEQFWGLQEMALDHFNAAVEQAKSLKDDSLELMAISKKADTYLDLGEIDRSVDLYLKAVSKAESLKRESLQALVYGSLAEVYRVTDQLEYALRYNSKALAIARHMENEHSWAKIYNNMGATLGEFGQNNRAIDTLKRALQLISDSNYFARAKFFSNIGYCYRNMEQYDSALYYHGLALILKKKHGFANTIAYSLDAIGRAYIGLGVPDSAIKYIREGHEQALKYGNSYQIKDILIHLSEAYALAKDYSNAFYYLRIAKDKEDALFEDDMEFKVNLYQKKYDISKKERELQTLKTEQLIEEEKNRSNIIIMAAVAILFVLLTIIFALLSKRRRQEKELVKLQLEQSQGELEQNKKTLDEFTRTLGERNQLLLELNQELLTKDDRINQLEKKSAIEKKKLTELKILTDSDWSQFKQLFEKVYPAFFDRLNKEKISFTKGEKRLMALIKLNLNNKEAANILGISSESVSKSRFRLKKKLSLTEEQDLEHYVHGI